MSIMKKCKFAPFLTWDKIQNSGEGGCHIEVTLQAHNSAATHNKYFTSQAFY